ncbi:uncharacterized protein [Parasteatoda tepidariorum]|uniref:uncharacterized protein n=1 Tax=Parasteatoda tepidariorum TaxID=114398 RepID=UPI001C71CBA5|nr:mediator of RNA polymerase II transcription subunit 12-like [Parasteatoda tepidariorum]
MQVLAILVASFPLITAQFPFPFRNQGFRNVRTPLTTSASRQMPYLSIPIVLMPDGQMVQKPGPINYKYLGDTTPLMSKQVLKSHATVIEDTSPQYQFSLTPPSHTQSKMPDATIYTGASQKHLRNADTIHLSSPINTQVIHSSQFQLQRQRNNPSQQHLVLNAHHFPSKQHVVNFLNFASQIGSNVLAKQQEKDIPTQQGSVHQESPLKKLPNHESYIVQGISYAQVPDKAPASQQQTGSHSAQVVQNLPLYTYNNQQQGQQNQNQVQFVVPQQYTESSDPKHPFQGIHLQGSIPNTQEVSSRVVADGQNNYNKINGHVARNPVSQQTENPTKQSQISYNPQYQSIILQPQSGHVATKNGGSELHFNRPVQFNHQSYHRNPQEAQPNPASIQQQSLVIHPQQPKAVKPINSFQASPHYVGHVHDERNFASVQASQDGTYSSETNNPQIHYKSSEVPKQETVPVQHSFDYSYVVNSNPNLDGHPRQRDLISGYENQRSVGSIPATHHYAGQPDLSVYQSQTGSFSHSQQENRQPHQIDYTSVAVDDKQEAVTENEKTYYTTSSKDTNYTPKNQHDLPTYGHLPASDQRSKVAETNGHPTKETSKQDTETEEETDYKVVYIPLDILKNILGNSVDGQKVENVS